MINIMKKNRIGNRLVTGPASFSRATTILATLLLISSLLIGCGDCSHKTIETLQKNGWTTDLEYRVCGSYSGFTVSIYLTKEGHPGFGEGSKEPFQAAVKSSEPYSFKEPPISIKWIDDSSLRIQHETRMSVGDPKSKLMIFKADKQYQGISISYDPEPVIWER